jgi:hypothetical protein
MGLLLAVSHSRHEGSLRTGGREMSLILRTKDASLLFESEDFQQLQCSSCTGLNRANGGTNGRSMRFNPNIIRISTLGPFFHSNISSESESLAVSHDR